MDYTKVETFHKLSLGMIYRLFLKNMKNYPSKNRFELLTAIQQQFEANKKLADKDLIKKERLKAEMGLRHMYYYISKSKEMSSSKIYHNTDVIEPFAKKKEDQIYF